MKPAVEKEQDKKEEREKNSKKISQLSLKKRKEIVQEKLKIKEINSEMFNELLIMDNTNEELIYRYIISLSSDENIALAAMQKYSYYISFQKIKDIQMKVFKGKNMGFRSTSYKTLFFNILNAIYKGNELDSYFSIIKTTYSKIEKNNQPFDLENFEAFYYYLCSSLETEFHKYENNRAEYISSLEKYIKSIKSDLDLYKKDNYEEEKKDIKKFLTIFYSILNVNMENILQFTQFAYILKKPDILSIKKRIEITAEDIKGCYGQEIADKFLKKVEDEKIFSRIETSLIDENDIEIQEKCYIYDYISKNNIFKQYEKELINLLKVIFKSDLMKSLVKIIYKTEGENILYYFDEENSIEDLWNNKILFVPYKIKNVSSFTYRDTFHILIPIYKFSHFESTIENEIFTLGAFIRVIIREVLGHLMASYFFYMFYVNIGSYNNYLFSMKDKISELNKKIIGECVGYYLAKICKDNSYKINETDFFRNKFENIIGKNYAEKLIKILFEEKKIDVSKDEENVISNKIIGILMEFIYDEFNSYISDLEKNNEKYKDDDSGNLVEFLLFSNFGQDINLKECLFLLNEKNYKITNIFKYRSEFINLKDKQNDIFLSELIRDDKIFKNLFSRYISFYNKNKNGNHNLNIYKNFVENSNINLNRKYESFECVNKALYWISSSKKDN